MWTTVAGPHKQCAQPGDLYALKPRHSNKKTQVTELELSLNPINPQLHPQADPELLLGETSRAQE